ncbi:MAG: hypothetical protein HY721_22140 [Planctomycetes bacterium]|nr:hypothetical protein [Planctomycetota bacterium]
MERTEQEDIPVPRDFELRRSYAPDWKISADLDRTRSWTGEYSGPGAVSEVAPWYVAEMQKHKWRFRGLQEKGKEWRALQFEKGGEVSEVQVYRELDAGAGAYVTVVRAKISPRGPEDFTVDESLRMKGSAVRPASYGTAQEDAEAVRYVPAPAPPREGPGVEAGDPEPPRAEPKPSAGKKDETTDRSKKPGTANEHIERFERASSR